MFQGNSQGPNTGFIDKLAAMDDERLPPDPGTAPVPQGHVRLWHYTPLANVPSIREKGLRREYARGDAGNGDLTDPSAGMWASTNPPDHLNHSEGHAGVVEFHAHPDEISGNAESPWRALNKDRSYDPEKLREWNSGHHHVIMRGSVPPENILAIHEPWHHAARYMRDGDPTLASYQWVKDDYARGGNDHLEPYVRGLRALEHGQAHREAALLGHFEASNPEDYRGPHQGPDADWGEAMHEVGSGGTYPTDFFERAHDYIAGDGPGAWDSYDKVRRSRDWPSRRVTMYRSLPSPHREVNTGDWVSSSAEYARQHGRQSDPADDWPVVKFEARADQLRTAGDSINEWSYHGPPVRRALVHFSGGANHRGKGPRGGKADAAVGDHEPPEMNAAYNEQNRQRRERIRAEREQREASVQHQGAGETAPEGHQVWAVPAGGRSPVAAEVYHNMTHREPGDEHGSNWYQGISYHGPYHVIRHPQTRQVWLVDRHGRDASPTGGHYGNPERDGNWGEHQAWEHQHGLESAGPEAHRFGPPGEPRLNLMNERVPEFPHSRVDPEDEERVRRPAPRVHAPEGVSPSDEYHGSYEVVQHPETGRYHVIDNAGRKANVLPLEGHATQLQAERSRDYTEKRQQSKEIGRGIANSIWEGGHEALDPGGTAESRQSEENMRTTSEMMDRYHGGLGEIKFDSDEEGGAPYYEREHLLGSGKASGWYAKHYGGAHANVYHRATGDEAHDLLHLPQHPEDENVSMTPRLHPDFGDEHLAGHLADWHDRPDGMREHLETTDPDYDRNARAIQRWKRQHLGSMPDVVAHFEGGSAHLSPLGGLPVQLHRGLFFGRGTAEEADELHRDPAAHLQHEHGVGVHWTDDENSAHNFARDLDPDGWAQDQGDDDGEAHSMGMVLHGEVGSHHVIKPGTPEWENYQAFAAVLDHDHPEREVPLRDNAPVRITHVTTTSTDPGGHVRETDHPWGRTHLASVAVVAHFEDHVPAPLGPGPHMQQKLFHAQPDPTLNAPDSGRHNPDDPQAHVRWRQEREEGYVPPPETWDDPVKGNRDDDGHYQHPGHGGYYCHACSGYQGEPTFHGDAETSENHETAATDWDEEYPHVPATVHRGLRIDGGAHLADDPDHERVARAILRHVGDDHMHWTGNEEQARHYAVVGTGGRGGAADLNVVLHARKPEREDIEEDPEVLGDRNVYGIGHHDDEEIPLRSGAPVHVTGITWRAHGHGPTQYPDTVGWQRHDFGEAAEHTAGVVAHLGEDDGHGDSLDAFRYQGVQSYMAPPEDYAQGHEHLTAHHGYTPEMHVPRNLPGLQNVHRGLHLPGPAGPASHQHDNPDDHHDPVFGSTAALTGGPDQLSSREERGDRWHDYQNQSNDHHHRGIIVTLPEHVDSYVHDEGVPREQRAAALQQHFADSGEGLGTHWTPHPRIAQRAIWNAASGDEAGRGAYSGHSAWDDDEDNGYDEDGDGDGGSPRTEVMFHVHRPGERNRLPQREHEQHAIGWSHSPDEDEFPLRPGSPLRLAGISWKRHEPDYPNEPFEHADFPKAIRHVSSRRPAVEEPVVHTAAIPPVVAHFGPPGHFDYYHGEGSEDGRPRTTELEEHLYSSSHGRPGWDTTMDEAIPRAQHDAYAEPGTNSQRRAGYHDRLESLHQGEHDAAFARAQQSVEGGADPFYPHARRAELERGHHEQWPGEQDERAEHQRAVAEHLEDGQAHMHGQDVSFGEMAHHLRSVHGIPHDALPEHQLPTSDYHDPYQSALEEMHEQHHGDHTLPETGSYRHTPHGQYVTMHWGPRTDFDAEHHLVEHHGMDIGDLRHREPDLEAEHERDHASNRDYLSHHLYTVMDPENHLPEHHGYQGPDAEELREGDPEHHFEVRSRDDEGSEHSGVYHAEDEDHAREMHEGAHPYDEIHHSGPAPVVPPRRQYTMPAAEHGDWVPAIGPLQAPSEHGTDENTSFSWQHHPYTAPPRSGPELWAHLREHHGVTQSADSTKPPGQHFMIGLHDKFHNGEMEDRGTPHQHDVPEGGHDPVFGSMPAVVAHFAQPAISLVPVYDAALPPVLSPLDAVTEAIRSLAAWDPQGQEDALAAARALPHLFLALRNGLTAMSAALEEMPVHPAVRDAVTELAAQAARAAQDADDVVRRLPTEATWEFPGSSPNR